MKDKSVEAFHEVIEGKVVQAGVQGKSEQKEKLEWGWELTFQSV